MLNAKVNRGMECGLNEIKMKDIINKSQNQSITHYLI